MQVNTAIEHKTGLPPQTYEDIPISLGEQTHQEVRDLWLRLSKRRIEDPRICMIPKSSQERLMQ